MDTYEPKRLGRTCKRTPELEEKMMECFRLGMTEQEVADIAGITKATITNWKKKFPEFFAALKLAKLQADNEVEGALLKSAKGHEHGSQYYPPNPTSMIFWLKNRQPKKWRDKVDVQNESTHTVILHVGNQRKLYGI